MKKYVLVMIILIVVLGVCGIIFRNHDAMLSAEEAEESLQNYLISASQWKDDYVIEALNPVTGTIENDEVYRFEIRYKDTNEQVGDRLISNYAITLDGNIIYWYDSANDEWIVQK